jgi:hypothetical protein
MFLEVVDCNLTLEQLTYSLDSADRAFNKVVKGYDKELLAKNDTIAAKKSEIKKLNEDVEGLQKVNDRIETKKKFWKYVAIIEGAVIVVIGGVIYLITII